MVKQIEEEHSHNLLQPVLSACAYQKLYLKKALSVLQKISKIWISNKKTPRN